MGLHQADTTVFEQMRNNWSNELPDDTANHAARLSRPSSKGVDWNLPLNSALARKGLSFDDVPRDINVPDDEAGAENFTIVSLDDPDFERILRHINMEQTSSLNDLDYNEVLHFEVSDQSEKPPMSACGSMDSCVGLMNTDLAFDNDLPYEEVPQGFDDPDETMLQSSGRAYDLDALTMGDISPESHSSVMGSGRFFVWRSHDWHPVPSNQAKQIHTALAQGQTVFDINDGPHIWTIDTTDQLGWVQIHKSTGRQRSIRQSYSLSSFHSASALPQYRFLPVPTQSSSSKDSRSQLARSDGKTVEPRLVSGLRREWRVLLNNVAISSKGESMKALSKNALIDAWVRSSGTTGVEYKILIEESIADAFLKIDLSRTNQIDEVEWLHYWLLENQAPSFHALVQVNEQMQKWLRREPYVLRELLKLFLKSCRSSEDTQLTASEMRQAASEWITQGSTNWPSLGPSVSAHPFRNRSKIYLQELLSKGLIDEDEMLSYYDFMNHMLGRRKSKVQLYQYDLSKGGARLLSPLLIGQQVGGIWHSSIVVHGREYYYGGKIYEAEPGSTAFGTPTKIVDLPEETMRTHDDFRNFLTRVLSQDFQALRYDVLNNNCNHFTDACCLFLLNRHIPDEVLMQSELVKKQNGTWAMQLLRPVVNHFLDIDVVGSRQLSFNDAPDEDTWTKIGEKSFVVWEHNEGWTRIAWVTSKGQDSCGLIWLDIHTGELHYKGDVNRSEVQELKEFRSKHPRGIWSNYLSVPETIYPYLVI